MSDATAEKEELTTEGTEVHGRGETLSDEALGLAFYHAMGGRGAETQLEYMKRYTVAAAAVRENVEGPLLAAKEANWQLYCEAVSERDRLRENVRALDSCLQEKMEYIRKIEGELEVTPEQEESLAERIYNIYCEAIVGSPDTHPFKNVSGVWRRLSIEQARAAFDHIQGVWYPLNPENSHFEGDPPPAASDLDPLAVDEGHGAVTCHMCTKKGWAQAGGWYQEGRHTICGECVKYREVNRARLEAEVPVEANVTSPTNCSPPEADRVRVAPVGHSESEAVAKSAAEVRLDWVREVVQECPSPVELTKSAKAVRYAMLWKGLYHA